MLINDRDENLQFLNAVRNIDKKYHEPALKRVAPKQVVPKRTAPASDRWLKVVIKKDCKKPPYGMLVLELPDKRTVLCSRKVVISPGNHALCLTTGTVGTARIERFNGQYRAIEARFDGDPPNEEETGRVVIWRDDKKQGWIERECKDRLFIAGTRWGEVVEIGDWVRFAIKRSKNPKHPYGYVGMDARKIIAPQMAQGEKDV
jgi:hypothetical protein